MILFYQYSSVITFPLYLVRGRINRIGDVVQNKVISNAAAVGIDDFFLDNFRTNINQNKYALCKLTVAILSYYANVW